MASPDGKPGTGWWRSRAFLEPLLITIGGVVGNIAIYLVVVDAVNPPCPDAECGNCTARSSCS